MKTSPIKQLSCTASLKTCETLWSGTLTEPRNLSNRINSFSSRNTESDSCEYFRLQVPKCSAELAKMLRLAWIAEIFSTSTFHIIIAEFGCICTAECYFGLQGNYLSLFNSMVQTDLDLMHTRFIGSIRTSHSIDLRISLPITVVHVMIKWLAESN